MTVTISKPPINLREQLTELKAQQGYEEQQFHFDNLVTNGTFDTDTSGWNSTGGATLSHQSGKLRVTNDADGFGAAYHAVTCAIGKSYVITVDVSFPSGVQTNRIVVDDETSFNAPQTAGSVADAASGQKTLTFVATSTTHYVALFIWSGTASAEVDFDNISVYEVDPADDKVIHTMPKGWKPLHVFEDGALQREGSAYDYTVEYDGFNYIVKETVAPVAPYSTTVIGVRA